MQFETTTTITPIPKQKRQQQKQHNSKTTTFNREITARMLIERDHQMNTFQALLDNNWYAFEDYLMLQDRFFVCVDFCISLPRMMIGLVPISRIIVSAT